MGGVDSIPVISQVKSLGQVIIGDVDGAQRTQENFSKQAVLVSQIRSAVEATYDPAAAERTQQEFLKHLPGTIIGNFNPILGLTIGSLVDAPIAELIGQSLGFDDLKQQAIDSIPREEVAPPKVSVTWGDVKENFSQDLSYEQYEKIVDTLFGFEVEARQGLKGIRFSASEVQVFSKLIQYQDNQGQVSVMEAVGAKKGKAYSLLSVGINAQLSGPSALPSDELAAVIAVGAMKLSDYLKAR